MHIKKMKIYLVSIIIKIRTMLFESISFTNSLDFFHNQSMQYSLMFSFLQLIGFLLNQANDDDYIGDNTNENINEEYINLFKIINNILHITYSPMFANNIKMIYFIAAYMLAILAILIMAIFTKYHIIHYILSFFVSYHSHIFAFFIHNICIKYVFNNQLCALISQDHEDQLNSCETQNELIITMIIIMIFINSLNILLCFYFDIFYHTHEKQYILAKYSHIIDIIYQFSRIIIVIIVNIAYLDQNVKILANSVFLILICILQIYLLIKYNIYTIWNMIKLYIICYTMTFSISSISLLLYAYGYNFYIFIPILIITPFSCKIMTNYALNFFLNRLSKNLETLQNEWECLAHYYSFQDLYSSKLHKSKFIIESISEEILLNGLMNRYYRLCKNDMNWYYDWNNIESKKKMNHFVDNQNHLSEFSRILLENYLRKFPNSILLTLHLIQNLMKKSKLYNKSLLMIENIKHKHNKLSIMQEFMIFEMRKAIENVIKNKSGKSKNNEFEIINLIRFIESMKEFHNLFSEQITNSIILWKELLRTRIQLIIIFDYTQKIFEVNKRIQTLWIKIDSIGQQKIGKPYLLYGLYNYVIINSRDIGDKMIETYKKILRMNIILESKIEEGIYDDYNNIFLKDNAYFIVSGETHDLGMIIDCSDHIIPEFGYEKDEMINRNIDMIIPPIYRKNHEIYMMKYINNKHKALYNHSSDMYFVNKNMDLTSCSINIKDSYHEMYGMIFFILIRCIITNDEYILINDDGIIDSMSKKIKNEVGFESKIPNKSHFDSIFINLVRVDEFCKKQGIKDENMIENDKYLNGNIIKLNKQMRLDYQDDNNLDCYYMCYIEELKIGEESIIHKATLKRIFNENLDLELLQKYKVREFDTLSIKPVLENDFLEIPNEESSENKLEKILDFKLGININPKRFLSTKVSKLMEKSEFPTPYIKPKDEKDSLLDIHLESLIICNSIPDHILKNSNGNIQGKIKKELRFDPSIGTSAKNSSSKNNIIHSFRNIRLETDLKKDYIINGGQKVNKKSNSKSTLRGKTTMMTTITVHPKTALDTTRQNSQLKTTEDKRKIKYNKEALLKVRHKTNIFDSSQDRSSGTYEYQKFIQKALKVVHVLKDIHLMKVLIYPFLIIQAIIIIMNAYYQMKSIEATQTSSIALDKNYDKIIDLLNLRLYSTLLYLVDSGLVQIDRHEDMDIPNYHDFCLFNLNETLTLLTDANSDFSDFLYANIEPKYRDQIALTEIIVDWDLEDDIPDPEGFSFSKENYSISTAINLLIHQTFILINSNLSVYDMLNPQLNFLLTNDGGSLFEQNFKSSDIFQKALFEYLQNYLDIQISLFCLGLVLAVIGTIVFCYIIYKVLAEKIKILKIFTLIRPEEIKLALERFNLVDNWVKMKVTRIKNVDKSLDKLFAMESIRGNSNRQKKKIEPNIISKPIMRSYIGLFIKLNLVIVFLAIFYSISIYHSIDFEAVNVYLSQKSTFLNKHFQNILLSISLTYQFLERNATGYAYHDQPESGDITTFLGSQLQNERDSMNILDELSEISPDMDYLLNHDICNVNPDISEDDCLRLANGALNLGLIGTSSFIYKVLHDTYQGFLTSNRTAIIIQQTLDDPDLKDIELIASFYLVPLIETCSSMLDNLFEVEVEKISNTSKTLTIVAIILLILMTKFVLLNIQEKLEEENKEIKKLLKLIPDFIYFSNKYLEQNLLKMTPGINLVRRI